jgi:hypothetical protein
MWDLICDHQYIWGTIAADRSRWHSDGFSSGVTPVAGGGLNFSTPDSRVVIPRRTGDPWGSMGAIYAEIVLSSRQASFGGGAGTIIDADGCFRVSIAGVAGGHQSIFINILNRTIELAAPSSPAARIKIYLSHDGVNQFSGNYTWGLPNPPGGGGGTIDEPIIMPGQVPPVGPQGVWIGNRIGSPNFHLNGSIFSVKIWRADPQTIPTTFVGRPFTPPELKCWEDLIDKFKEAAASDPVCARWWTDLIEQQQNQFVTRLGQKSPATVAQFYQMCAAYQQLWSGGKVGSPEMQALMVKLRDWLKSEGIFSADDPGLRETLQNPCMAKYSGLAGSFNCDPDAQAMIKAILGVPN